MKGETARRSSRLTLCWIPSPVYRVIKFFTRDRKFCAGGICSYCGALVTCFLFPLALLIALVALIVVILITGTLSFIQESRSASIAKQYEEMQPQTANVIREAIEQEVPAEELVLGDIIVLRTGDRVPADCRILEANNLMVDNSALTGESEPQERDINCTHDDAMLTRNMAFYSTWVVQVGVVCHCSKRVNIINR